jgi:hypothetical protein
MSQDGVKRGSVKRWWISGVVVFALGMALALVGVQRDQNLIASLVEQSGKCCLVFGSERDCHCRADLRVNLAQKRLDMNDFLCKVTCEKYSRREVLLYVCQERSDSEEEVGRCNLTFFHKQGSNLAFDYFMQ